jgi:hypothetical protein
MSALCQKRTLKSSVLPKEKTPRRCLGAFANGVEESALCQTRTSRSYCAQPNLLYVVFSFGCTAGGDLVTLRSDRVACGRTKEPPLIREAAFASLKAPLRPVPAQVDPTDASEEREASGR